MKTPFAQNYKIKKSDLSEVSINYAYAGKGKKIVFVHGLGGCWENFIPLTEKLKKKYQVIMVDLPGYGDSSRLRKYSLENQAEYVIEFVKKEFGKVHCILGLSMGSGVVSYIPNKDSNVSEKIILMGAALKSKSKKVFFNFSTSFLKLIRKSSVTSSFFKKMFFGDIATYLINKFVHTYNFDWPFIDTYTKTARRKMSNNIWIDMWLGLNEIRIEELLDNSKIPVYFIFGEKDKVCSPEVAKKLMSPKKGSYFFEIVKNAGHSVHFDSVDEVAQRVLKCLN